MSDTNKIAAEFIRQWWKDNPTATDISPMYELFSRKFPDLNKPGSRNFISDVLIGMGVEFLLNNVKTIPARMFAYRSSITNINIPDTVTGIGFGAFRGCSNLTDVHIPTSVTWIGGTAFMGCTSLESLTIPEGVERISQNCFSGCTHLESIKFPSTLTVLGYDLLEDCGNLKDLSYNGTTSQCRHLGLEELINSRVRTNNPTDTIKYIQCTNGKVYLNG